ncbi:(Na+)-NQR maturation NqrM [Aliikangiella maris]|uniref:(Na+)-NQR maturation NqrM n=2 Tax=Aliikangiella maris TaxID=3162458 RepID=A0ABV2BWN2_9GAMM
MKVFIFTFVLMLIVIAIMAVGYIFQQKKISGSCGGISSLGLEKMCDCDEPCDNRKKLLAQQEAERKAEYAARAPLDIKVMDDN